MADAPDDVGAYCRQIEAYLCRRNEGHLIRVVGPSFDLVSKWAIDGVPLKVAFQGIDRTVERHARKATRRRPIKIDFCEADVMDVFDEWRRALGVTGMGRPTAAGGESTAPARRGPSLPEHLERGLARLSQARATGTLSGNADAFIDRVSAEFDRARGHGRGLRGEDRQALIARLDTFDAELAALAREDADPVLLAQVETEVESDLSRFRGQMSAEAFARARNGAVDQMLRERLRLPTLRFT
jgi:hypothetical protein